MNGRTNRKTKTHANVPSLLYGMIGHEDGDAGADLV
jgi:hypothetical protein